MPDGVAVPPRLRVVGRQRAAVREDLANAHARLVEDHEHVGRLDELARRALRVELHDAHRQAGASGLSLPFASRRASSSASPSGLNGRPVLDVLRDVQEARDGRAVGWRRRRRRVRAAAESHWRPARRPRGRACRRPCAARARRGRARLRRCAARPCSDAGPIARMRAPAPSAPSAVTSAADDECLHSEWAPRPCLPILILERAAQGIILDRRGGRPRRDGGSALMGMKCLALSAALAR